MGTAKYGLMKVLSVSAVPVRGFLLDPHAAGPVLPHWSPWPGHTCAGAQCQWGICVQHVWLCPAQRHPGFCPGLPWVLSRALLQRH
jgi:hypothetical protein